MSESVKLTEGLGSAMLSIWLRDVLGCRIVLQEHGDYTHSAKLGLSHNNLTLPKRSDS